jgi:hypothetical protein
LLGLKKKQLNALMVELARENYSHLEARASQLTEDRGNTHAYRRSVLKTSFDDNSFDLQFLLDLHM